MQMPKGGRMTKLGYTIRSFDLPSPRNLYVSYIPWLGI